MLPNGWRRSLFMSALGGIALVAWPALAAMAAEPAADRLGVPGVEGSRPVALLRLGSL